VWFRDRHGAGAWDGGSDKQGLLHRDLSLEAFIGNAVVQALPSALALKARSSPPANPISAWPDQPV
jgi:hypothetical protein